MMSMNDGKVHMEVKNEIVADVEKKSRNKKCRKQKLLKSSNKKKRKKVQNRKV